MTGEWGGNMWWVHIIEYTRAVSSSKVDAPSNMDRSQSTVSIEKGRKILYMHTK